jgi:osmotically-inducible protein OsmY
MKSDSQVQQDVLAELDWEPAIDASLIAVDVAGGVVTLTGQTSSYAEKLDAAEAARRVGGVRALTVAIEVALPAWRKNSDAEITVSVKAALHWLTKRPLDSVTVGVEDGWITLSGDVDWEYQRQAATAALRNIRGVRGVDDQVSIRPQVSHSAVKAEIAAALNRRARTEAQSIAVDVSGCDVTLTGTVHSWSERDLARHSAWASPGVRNVVDNISVVD